MRQERGRRELTGGRGQKRKSREALGEQSNTIESDMYIQ